MKYTQEAVNAAYSVIEARRQDALNIYDAHVANIKKSHPEIYDIFLDISNTSSKLARVIFSKNQDGKPAVNVTEAVEKIKNENLENQKKLKNALLAFGYPDDYLTVKYTCPICGDTGIHLGNRCKCAEELMTSLTISKLNEQCKIKLHNFSEFDLSFYPVTYQYNGTTYDCRNKMAEILDFCIGYVNNFSESSQSLFMLGKTGLGKTFLSSCIANELIRKGVNVAFDSIQNYLRYIENEHFGRAEGDTLELLLNAELLILDDLGCEFKSSFNSATIYNLINSRCNMGKPTIVSSNLSINELSERYDDRIISRLIGNYHTLRFIGEDIRQIKRREGIFN
ncbi:MAG: ATP-binding protein [Oscillospiraceae bacterium]|nr:ATP-binding protein [Oscillospiraceae bacterium]